MMPFYIVFGCAPIEALRLRPQTGVVVCAAPGAPDATAATEWKLIAGTLSLRCLQALLDPPPTYIENPRIIFETFKETEYLVYLLINAGKK